MSLRDRLALMTLALTYPLVIAGLLMAMGTFRNDIAGWLAEDSPSKAEYEEFVQRFGLNEALVVSWSGCSLDDDRLSVLRERLEKESTNCFASITSGKSLTRKLADSLDIPTESAVERLKGIAVGSDGTTTGLILRLTKQATQQREEALAIVFEACSSVGLPREQLRISGIAHDLHSLDYEGLWSPLRAVPFIMLCSFLLAWLFLCQLDLSCFVAALSSYVGFLSMSLVYISGLELSAVVWTLPTLTMLLTMSAQLHFLGYYRFALAQASNDPQNRCEPVQVATLTAFRPTLLCSVTTAAGLFSLVLSKTPPVQQFGFFGGVCVLLSAGLVLWCLPAWLRFRHVSLQTLLKSPALPRNVFAAQAASVIRFRTIIALIFFGVMVYLATSISSLTTSVNIRNLFPNDSKLIQDATWIEENFINLGTVDVTLRFDETSADDDLAKLRLINRVTGEIRKNEQVGGILSALTLMPPMQRERPGIAGVIARRTNGIKLRELRESLEDETLLSVASNGTEYWRMSLMVSNLNEFDTQKLERNLASSIHKAQEDVGLAHVSWTATGSSVVFGKVEDQFLSDLRSTYSTAMLIIVVIVLVLVRSLAVCLLLTLPNVFPAVLVLGTVAMIGLPLDVASLMTASVALGIGVDDTLHYALWWRKRLGDGLSNQAAIVDTMHHCGVAMIQTSLVTGLSVSLYIFCGFLPTVRFGILLSSMLFAALLADLFLLPSLLSMPIARRSLRLKEASA